MSDATHQQTPTPRPRGPDDADPSRDLWSLWRRGQQPRVEDFLERAGVRDLEQVVMALRVDQYERCRLGQWVSAEAYLDAFPAIKAAPELAVDLIFAEFLLREERGDRPPLEEFLGRFPEHAAELKLQIELHRALEAGDEPTANGSGSSITVPLGEGPEPSARSTIYPEVPGYEIRGILGRGGMGLVYRAWQAELKRSVALKMLHAGALAGPEALARFRVEAEAVARLHHAHIVRIHGVGEHGGAPFLVLELVDGRSLAQTLNGTPQPAEWAARMIETLARAIHSAHLLGVVHRDLTPANVLMAADGTPRITDFGLAKLILGGGSMRTATGDVMGTPSYMAPEQAGGDAGRIGPATDVYALGAILYEMLTGRPPFKAEQPMETMRQVLSDEPVSPSRLRPRLPRDLETICLRCLNKEPARRYATAEALADELRRFLEGRSIQTRRSTAAERAWRWCRRNPWPATAAMLMTILAIGATSAAWALRHQLDEVRKAKAATDAALGESERSRQKAEAVGSFLVEAFRRPDPDQDGKDVKVVDVLDRAARALDREFSGPAAVRGALHEAMGLTYIGLGEYGKSIEQHQKAIAVREAALGPDHPETLQSRNSLALAYIAAGRIRDAIALELATLKTRESRFGPDHPDTLSNRHDLALAYFAAGRTDEAIAMDEVTLRARESRLGADNHETLATRNNLARGYGQVGRYSEAIALLEVNLGLCDSKLGPSHTGTLSVRDNLARAYQEVGRSTEAVALLEATFRLREAKLPPDHPDMLRSRTDLALAYQKSGRFSEAIAMGEEAFKLSDAKLGPDHPLTVQCRNDLALAYAQVGRLSEAIAMDRRTLELVESTRPPILHDVLRSRNNLARDLGQAGRIVEAIAMFEPILAVCESKLGPFHSGTLTIRNNLAEAYERLGRWPEAEALRRDTLARRRRTNPPTSTSLARDLAGLASNLFAQDRSSDAEPFLREGLAIFEKVIPDDVQTFDLRSRLGGVLLGRKEYAVAEPLILAGYEGMKAREARIPAFAKPALLAAAVRVVRLYEARGEPEQVVAWKRKLGLSDLPDDPFAPGR